MSTNRIAYTVIISGPNADGQHYRLVGAEESGGFRTLKETGADDDPFYVAKGPIWFDTREEGEAEANRRNASELGLDEREALAIVFASMSMTKRAGR